LKPQTETALAPLLLDPDGPRVAAVGGGHGLASALEAIQSYAGEISALVSVADDGGSSGRLVGLGHPPPGDVRRCLLSLTPEPSLWSELFAHRFREGDVAEHSLGNLILAGLADIFGDFGSAVSAAERMLGTVGSVIPVADEPVSLRAVADGVEITGQRAIAENRGRITRFEVDPAGAEASLRALLAVAAADQIVIGPGSLYTSVIAALKVNLLAPAIMDAPSQRVLILNLITQDGETFDHTGSEHVAAVAEHGGVTGPGAIVVHDGPLAVPEGHHGVTVDISNAGRHGWEVVYADVADAAAEWPQHDPIKLGMVLEDLAEARSK